MPLSPFSAVKADIAEAIGAELKSTVHHASGVAESIDRSKGFGDFSSSIAFRIAREQKRNPNDVAAEIASGLKGIRNVERVTAEGGFVNFHLDRPAFSTMTVNGALKEGGGFLKSDSGKGKSVMIEYISTNPNKPWHIGHLRNALLGDALANLYDACGYKVERENYVEDLGLQMVESLWGYLKLSNKPDKKFDQWLGEEYVKVNRHMQANDIKEELSKLMELVEQDGTYERKMVRDIAEMCESAQYETARNYNISQDVMIWESDIVRARLVDKALGLLTRSDAIRKETSGEYRDCVVMDLDRVKELPKEFEGVKERIKVLVRSNGTANYVMKDIAFHMWKFGMVEDTFLYRTFIDRQADGKPLYTTSGEGKRMKFGSIGRAINLIDARQSHPQAMLKLAFRAMGRDDIADSITHLAYAKVDVAGGSLSGRKGTWIGYSADDLIAEAEAKARTLIGDRFKIDREEHERIARLVALAAIKFEFMGISPEKEIMFTWDRALNFSGVSGPYCQYTYARATRIIESSGMKHRLGSEFAKVSDHEFEMVKLLSMARDVVQKACRENRPNAITDYLDSLATAFSAFYETTPVLKAESEKDVANRVALVAALRDTVGGMLRLIGIEPIERM
ncbi:MAG: arginine--tRNA ligase [Candidatus Micrarchaeota archaeon]|nr:arginine--tRNA ligase [Candidatus Micrarchaeota archaeon]